MNTEQILKRHGLYNDVISVIFDFLYGTKRQNQDEFSYTVIHQLNTGHDLESSWTKTRGFNDCIHAMMSRNKTAYETEFSLTLWCECCISFSLISEKNIYYQLRLNKIERTLTQFLTVFPKCFDKKIFDYKDVQRLIKILSNSILIKEDYDLRRWSHCGECFQPFYENIGQDDINVTPHGMKNFYLMLKDRSKVNRFYIDSYMPKQKIFDRLPIFPCLELQILFYENINMLERYSAE